jgi:hypothetical protein
MLRFVRKLYAWAAQGHRAVSAQAPRPAAASGRAIACCDWLLLLAAFEGAPDGLDPVRFQAGLFLFSRRPDPPPRSKYAFEAGVYGPVSDGVYADLDRLTRDRLLEQVPVAGLHWSLYRPTDGGYVQARRILRHAEDQDLRDVARELFEIKRYLSSVGFGELLERVYREHPDYAVNSVFRSAA